MAGPADKVVEAAGEGIDLVKSSVTYTLANNIENLTLSGGGAINGTGNSLNNLIIGNDGANKLGGSGGNGNDNLSGGSSNDSLSGGSGNDTLTGVNAGATIPGVGEIDTLTGGSGVDRFVLGTSTLAYYNDGNSSSRGLGDYVLLTDYDGSQDTVQFAGTLDDYVFGSSPIAGISGTAVYIDTDSNGVVSGSDELVVLLQSSSSTSSISTEGFVFTGPVG